MRAVWFRVVVELRARWRANLAVVLLVGLGGTLALGAFAGARRTASAYPRFLDAQHASDFGTASGPYNDLVGLGTVDVDEVRALPQVERVETHRFFFAGLLGPDGEGFLINPGSFAAFADDPGFGQERPRTVEGRLPAADARDEIAIGFEAAREAGIEVGDHVQLVVLSVENISDPSAFGAGEPYAVAPMEVVGTAAFPGAFPPNPRFGQYVLSPVFVDGLGDGAVHTDAVFIDATPGVTEGAFKAELDRLGGGRQLFFSQAAEAASVQRSIDLEAGALRIFAIITAVTAFLIVGQALARLLFQDRDEYATLRALGMAPWQRRSIVMGRVGLVALLGAVVAVAGAWLSSAMMPLGLAAIAEPNPGLSFDPLVLGAGALIVITAVSLAAVPSAVRLSLRRHRQQHALQPSRAARALASVGVAPTATAGVRMAVDQGRGRTATPVRTVVAGVAVAIAALVAAVNVGGSIDRLLDTPRLYGWDHDAAYGNPYAPGIGESIMPVLEQRDDLAAIAAGTTLASVQIRAGDVRTSAGVQAFDLIRGAVHPPVVDGRWPQDLDEVALGSRVMQRLGIGVGDELTVDGGGGAATMEVVGRAVFPSFGDPNVAELGEAVGMTFQAYQRLGPPVEPTVFLVRVAAGRDHAAVLASIDDQLGSAAGGFRPERPGDLDGIARVDGLPMILAATLGLLAAATLIHALVTTIRRRRRDIAIMSTLGFVGAQVRRIVVWQAVTLTLMAVVVGVPLGIAGGRWLWRGVADRIGFVAAPVAGLGPAALIAAGTLLLAVVVALAPAQRAAHLRPGAVLRAE